MTHYYPLFRSIAYITFGILLIAMCGGLLIAGFLSIWPALALIAGIVWVYLGVRGISERKKHPMLLEDTELSFYDRGKQIIIPGIEIEKVWYNPKGIDKHISLKRKNGEEIDIPVLYGLIELKRKISKRYNLPS